MLRATTKLGALSLSAEAFTQNYANLQAVRWARKPLWMGTAKTKLFKVPPRPVIPKEESEELKRLFNNYRTQIKSLRKYLIGKYSVLLQAKSDTEQIEQAFKEDLTRCHEINEDWNAAIKVVREKRIAEDLASQIAFAKTRLVNELRKEEEKRAEAEEIVRQTKEIASTFITPDNIDEAIAYALDNPVDYNFAVDLEGNKIIGRETKPKATEEPGKVSVKQ